MGEKSGVSEQIITAPTGGGALHGIGESFAPDLHTGTGNFTVPIALPPGRNGLQPQLSLAYSTGTGNGPFGFGWNLSVPGVARKTSKGIPQYLDETDTFVLSGAEDLVSVEQLASPDFNLAQTRYQPRTEGLFARIVHARSVLENYWEVRTKDGLISYYGTPRPSAAPSDWVDPGALVDPQTGRKVASWRLTETRDPFGNRIVYEYEQDLGSASNRQWSQLYLKRIRYVDFGETQAQQFLVSVEFHYEDRPDPFSDYRSAFEIRTTRRCKRIEVHTHEATDLLTRSYDFIYLDERTDFPNLAARMPPNKASLLSQIRVVGHDGLLEEALPPLEFGHTAFTPRDRRFQPLTGSELPAASLAHANLELADLFGTGLPDIFEMDGSVRYWRNLGAGRFDLPREMRTAPSGLQLGDSNVQLLDANGDGRVDLLVTSPALSGYFPLRFSGEWDARSFQRYRQAPSFNLKDPEVKLLDLDGDGVTDALRSGERLEAFFNDPEKGWTRTRRIERKALEDFPNVNFSDTRVKVGDMSGDGMQDIVLVHDGACVYWPNLGYGDWGKPIYMRNSPRFPYGYNPQRILVADVDGDGAADIVYVDDKSVTLWINQSGNGWSEPIVITGTPPVSDMDAVRLVDMLGVGVRGVLWSSNAGGLSRQSMSFLDFTGGAKPYLLSEIDNHMGAVTRVHYAPSTRFLLDDQKKPATRWRTPLPFPVHVVERVEVIDELSRGKLTTEYRYHHGYWDGAEREFRGFGMVEQFDSETFERYNQTGLHGSGTAFIGVTDPQRFSPPTCTRTWFHQGPVGEEFGDWTELDQSADFWSGDPGYLDHKVGVDAFLRTLPERRTRRDALRALRGNILRSELYGLDGTSRADRPYTVTEHAYGVRQEAVSLDEGGRAVFFPHAVATRTTQWERGDDPLTRFNFTDTQDFDPFGLALRSTAIACPRGWRTRHDRPSEPYLATRSRTTYAVAADGTYLHSRVARSTSFELTANTGSTLDELRRRPDNDPSLSMIGQTNTYYDGLAFEGLPLSQLGAFGAPTRTESLVLTDAILVDAYRSGPTVLNPPERPPYLDPVGAPAWTSEYPAEFRTLIPLLAGYVFHRGGLQPEDTRGYFSQSARRGYDFQLSPGTTGRGLVLASHDPLGHDTTITYDRFDLMAVSVTDPAQMVVRAEFDYRVLLPRRIVDPNQNDSVFTFSPLGLLSQAFVRGKSGEGDRTKPGLALAYNFLAFVDSKRLDPTNPQPVYVHSTRRVHHDSDTDVPPSALDDTIESRQFSDGFGRQLQARAQAEDLLFGDPAFGDAVLPADQGDESGTRAGVTGRQRAPGGPSNVVVSGWQIYDNKGRVVEKYEPFYSTGFEYLAPNDAQFGEKVETFYDSRGQVIRSVNPDGSEQRVIFGVPGTIAAPDLSRPDVFEPTPWEAYTYDANDNAGRTHPATAASYRDHWNTPASILIDAVGRTVLAAARNRDKPANPGGPLPPLRELRTASAYDIRGNALTATDALGRVALACVYDLANQPLRVDSIDAGIRRTVLDAAGHPIEGRDGKGALVLRAYDASNRPTHMWAKEADADPVTLRGLNLYGDDPNAGATPQQAADGNLLGKLYRSYDEAGRLSCEKYDFKGGLIEKSRHVIGDEAILSSFEPPPPGWNIRAYRVDWNLNSAATLDARAAALLDPTEYRTSMRHDALGRATTLRCPQDLTGARKTLRPQYNRAGALQGVSLDGASYVAHIAYNAKGQRVLIAYGNGVMTRQAYDTKTFRLTRLRSERYLQTAPLNLAPSGAALQDFAYESDLVGNITRIHDRTPDSGIPGAPLGRDALDRDFTYDALYRLLSGNGRECDRPPDAPWDASPRCTDLTRTRAYTEAYSYDDAGNIAQLAHTANRVFALAPNSNRLASISIGQTIYGYDYDANGNLTDETLSRHFEWDHSDRMRAFRTQIEGAEPSVHAQYLYDASGQRVKKLVRRQGGQADSTTYIDGAFERYRIVQGASVQQSDTLHVMDNRSRVALVRVGASMAGDTSPPVKYQLDDHLGSCNVVVGGTDASASDFINREEYTPYGETSFGSFARKRYRFTGKERDEESGLAYHGARYCLVWLGRWANCDPLGPVDGLNLYAYARNCPVLLTDPGGTDADVDLNLQAPDVGTDINTQIPPTSGTGRDFSLETDSVTIKTGDGAADPKMLDKLARSPSDSAASDPKPKTEPDDPPTEWTVGGGGGFKSEIPKGKPANKSSVASQSVELTHKDGGKEFKGQGVATQEEASPASPPNSGKKTQKFELSGSLGGELTKDLKLSIGPVVSFETAGTPGASTKTFVRGNAELEYERKNLFIESLKLNVKASFEAGSGGNVLEGGVEGKLEYTWTNTKKNTQFGVVGGAEFKYSPPVSQDPTSKELQFKGGFVLRY